jgi:AcrR family transcriptional regulator
VADKRQRSRVAADSRIALRGDAPSAAARETGRIRRPQQGRSSATVSAIHQAIHAIAEQHGVDAITSKAVARRAGVSPGTLYQYFRSREALVAQWELGVMERGMAEVYRILAEGLARGAPIDEVVWALVHRAVLLCFETLWSEGKGFVGFATNFAERREFVENTVEFLASAVENAPSRARVIPTDLRLAIRVGLYTVSFAPYPASLRNPSPEETDAFARTVADMITRFLIAPVGAPRT